jgi:predicted TIM-barrel fold metal-dependent hydrolase
MKRSMIIDSHSHPAGPAMESVGDYTEMERLMLQKQAEAERVDTILEFMDKYGIDQSLGLISQGISILPDENERLINVARDHPEKFPVVMVGFSTPPIPSAFKGEEAAREIESYLKIPEVKGVGEWALMGASGMENWPELWARYRPIMDVLAENNGVALFHTGIAPYLHRSPRKRSNGTDGWSAQRALWFSNPAFIDDIATEYPEVPIIIAHIGVQGFFYFGAYADMALLVAARHENVYLETSSAPLEVVEKAVCEPAIGPEKILFGTDTPAPFGHYRYKEKVYPSYGKHPPDTYPDHYKYDMEVIEQLPLHDREKDMILGGNIARLFGID